MKDAAFEFFQRGIGFQQRGFFDVAVQEYDKALKDRARQHRYFVELRGRLFTAWLGRSCH
jgi:hypothetical protein